MVIHVNPAVHVVHQGDLHRIMTAVKHSSSTTAQVRREQAQSGEAQSREQHV